MCREALLFDSMDSSDILLPPSKPFDVEKARQKILDGFKIEYSPSKRQEKSEYSAISGALK